MSSAVNIIKSAFLIGCYAALCTQKRRLVSHNHNLISRSDKAPGKVFFRGFNCTFDELTNFHDAKAFESPELTVE